MDVPGFEIKKTIGKGGMGTAYLAIQESLGRQVVLKTMNTSQADQTDFLERFLNEGRIVAALRHPHIITIFDIGATDEVVYMSMEYVDGGDLKDKIQGGCSEDEALNVVENIADALHFAHHEGVIHRDVKPANILYRGDSTPLLSDFGIAKQTKIDAELTSTGTILGSPFYMSPEQAEGHKVDGRADIYSLGIIFYEMLTGERPYPGDSAIKIIVQHIQSPIPTLPEEFKEYQALLNLLVAKSRDDRFPDAGTVANYIREIRAKKEQALAGQDVIRAEVAPPEKKALLSAENARLFALTSMVVILVVGFGSFYYWSQYMTTSTFARKDPLNTESAGQNTANASVGTNGQSSSGETTPTTEMNQDDVVKALEWLAQARLKQNMLIEPPADNAHYYYSRLFPLDEQKATAGFSDIAERFVVLAEKEFSDRNYRQAQAYITLGLQVQPDNEGLQHLQSFIDTRERSVLENLVNFFTGNG